MKIKKKIKKKSSATPSLLKLSKEFNDSLIGSIEDYHCCGSCDIPSPNASDVQEDLSWCDPSNPRNMEAARSQSERCAKIALEYYNKKHGTNYELVDALASNGNVYDEIRFHCNFKAAKPNNSPSGDGNSPTKLFFAELYCSNDSSSLNVSGCCILKGNCNSNRCELCNEPDSSIDPKFSVKHPAHGFHRSHNYAPYALRSRAGSRAVCA